jgi:hypothetical protein
MGEIPQFESRPKTDLENSHKSQEMTARTQTEKHVLADE